MAYATVAQYRVRYDTQLGDERLAARLADASDIIGEEVDAAGLSVADIPPERLERICCDMVHRSIGDGTDAAMAIPMGATQASMAAGGYSESFTMGNPYGDLFLKDKERRALGIMSGRFAVAVPSYGHAEVPDD